MRGKPKAARYKSSTELITDSQKQRSIVDEKTNSFVNELATSDSSIKEKNARKKVYLSYKARVGVTLLIFIMLFALCLLFATKIFEKSVVIPITYKEVINEPDYRVYLKPNDFYTEQYLPKNKAYVATLIDNITVDMQYVFSIDDLATVNFDYKILAELIIENNNGKELGKKSYVILDSTKKTMKNSNEYVINESIKLDYNYYNQLANSFRAQYGVDTTSYLKVYMDVKKDSLGSNYTIDANNSFNVIMIPLSERVIEINIKSVSNDVTKQVTPEASLIVNKPVMVLVIFLLLITICVLVKVIRYFAALVAKKTPYDRYVKKLLKEYDRLIVEIYTNINFDDYNVINVHKFSELLDVRDNLKMPINYYNIIKGEKGIFFIKSNNDIYLLTVKNIDIENKTLDIK